VNNLGRSIQVNVPLSFFTCSIVKGDGRVAMMSLPNSRGDWAVLTFFFYSEKAINSGVTENMTITNALTSTILTLFTRHGNAFQIYFTSVGVDGDVRLIDSPLLSLKILSNKHLRFMREGVYLIQRTHTIKSGVYFPQEDINSPRLASKWIRRLCG
jgi:hypothetical protein